MKQIKARITAEIRLGLEVDYEDALEAFKSIPEEFERVNIGLNDIRVWTVKKEDDEGPTVAGNVICLQNTYSLTLVNKERAQVRDDILNSLTSFLSLKFQQSFKELNDRVFPKISIEAQEVFDT